MIRTNTILCTLAILPLVSCERESPSTPSSAPSTSTIPSAPPPNPLAAPDTTMPTPSEADPSGTQLEAQGVTLAIPASWVQETPSHSMRAAQYRVPAPTGVGGSGIPDGEFVVFRGIGGSVEDNIARWENQVTDLAVPRLRATRSDRGITIDSLVQFGTYNAGTAMSDAGPQPNWGFAGAVISGGPQGPIYLRLTGPREVVDARLAEWGDVLASIMREAPAGMR